MSDDEWDAYLRQMTGADEHDYSWSLTGDQPYEIDTSYLLPGQEGYGWRYFSDGTAIAPSGKYYYQGSEVYDPGNQSSLGNLFSAAMQKLPSQLLGAAKSTLFKPDGSLNLAAMGTLAAAAYGARGGNQITPGVGGYSEPIPKLAMTRGRVEYDDADRRPGAQGREYFTAPVYTPRGVGAPTPAPAPAPASAKSADERAALVMAEGGEVPQFKGPLQSGGFVVPGDVVRHADPAGAARKEAGLRTLYNAMGAQAIRGPGDAMSDSIPTSIDGQRPAAVANGEAYIPPAKVAEIGGGSMKRGSERLYEMMDRLRVDRTGSKRQINPDNPRELARAYRGGAVEKFSNGGVTGTPTTSPVGFGTSQASTLAPWAGEYVTTALGQGAAAADEPFQVYKGPLTAGPSALQQQAFAGAQGIASAGYTPTQFTNAYQAPGAYNEVSFTNQYSPTAGYTAGAFGSEDLTQARAAQYMNPYLNLSLQPQLQEAQRQADIARLADAARLTKAGAYGGSRQAIMESEGRRNLLDIQGQIAGRGYDTAYEQALRQFNADRDSQFRAAESTEASRQFAQQQAQRQAELGAQYGLEALRGQSGERQFGATQAQRVAVDRATTAQQAQEATERSRQFGAEYGLKSLADLANLGATQRGIEAEGIAADKASFEEQRDRPLQMAQYKMDLLGTLPQGSVSAPNTTGLGSLTSQLQDLLTLYTTLGGK